MRFPGNGRVTEGDNGRTAKGREQTRAQAQVKKSLKARKIENLSWNEERRVA